VSNSAFALATSPDALRLAWAHILSNSTARSRRSHGIDFQTINDFDSNPTGNCRSLSRDLRDGYFHFSPLVAHLIPKKDGRYRVICVPTVRDRIVQRAISDFLASGDRCGLRNSVSFGFIPGRSVERAAKLAKKLRRENRWAYKTDITSFFDEIKRDVLRKAIQKSVREKSLHGLLTQASNSEIHESKRTRSESIKRAGIHEGVGLRQGMPLSPFFANLVLKNFDKKIEGVGIQMIRYADDLICFATSEDNCLAIHKTIAKALEVEGLSIPDPGHSSKTQIYAPNQVADFLGVSLRPEGNFYVLEVGKTQSDKVVQRLHDMGDISQLVGLGVDLSGFFRRIDGVIAGYDGAYSFCDNAVHFQKVLEDARRESIAHLFESGLGMPVSTLTPEKKKFLGIEK
jgi:RNA-directed DNA polymerase